MAARIHGPKNAPLAPEPGAPRPEEAPKAAPRAPSRPGEPRDRDVHERGKSAKIDRPRDPSAIAAKPDPSTSAVAAKQKALEVERPYARFAARGAFEGMVETAHHGALWVKVRPGTAPESDPPIVSLGAVNASSETTAEMEDALASGGRTVISILLPGQGETLAHDLQKNRFAPPSLERELSAGAQASAVIETLDALGVDAPVRAVGHGYGALIAAEAKKKAPERFGELFLIRPYVASSVQLDPMSKASHDFLAYNPFLPLGHVFYRPLAEAAHGVVMPKPGRALAGKDFAHSKALGRLMECVDQAKLVDSVRGLEGVSWLVIAGDRASPDDVNALVYESTPKDGALDVAPAKLAKHDDLVRAEPELCAKWVLDRIAKRPVDPSLRTHESTAELAKRARQVAQEEHAVLDFFAELCEGAYNGAATVANAVGEAATFTRWAHFPRDFEAPISVGGPGKGMSLGGFGGIANKTQAENRRALKRTPVILVHGNAATGGNPITGMAPIRDMLKKAGYNDAELWAPSYLGPGGASDLSNAHVENVEDLRRFIDAVMDYLGVDKVDIVAHSLGATLTRCWMKGLSSDEDAKKVAWKAAPAYDKVGTFVSLCGANQGMHYTSEWAPSGTLMGELNRDPTPHRAGAKPLADGQHVTYVSLWAEGDWVDLQNPGTGYLEGAELNQGFHLGYAMFGHLNVLSSRSVFDTFLPFLGRIPLARRANADE